MSDDKKTTDATSLEIEGLRRLWHEAIGARDEARAQRDKAIAERDEMREVLMRIAITFSGPF